MTYYFIDFENVHETGLKGVEALPEEDRVHLFYTVNANKVSWELFEICRSSNIILHKVAAGKQALDMMLSSFLGHTVANDPGARFVIISRDRDYDPVVDFWNLAEPPVAVSRFTSIAAACGQTPETEEPEAEEQPEARRTYQNRSRRGRSPLRSGTQRYARAVAAESAQQTEPATETPREPAESAAVSVKDEASAAEAAEPETAPVEEGKTVPAPEEKPEAAPEKKNARPRRTGRSRSVKAEKQAEGAKTQEPAEAAAPAEQEEKPAKAPKSAEKAGQEKKPAEARKQEEKPAEKPAQTQRAESARRNGAESNAVHNAVQKVLAQEKIESATIAALASLTAKNWGKPNDKQLIYRAVIKQFGQKEGLRLYGIMKPCLKG